MNDKEQRKAAKKFIEFWKDKGYEKGESQKFWLMLLRNVFGVKNPEEIINFEEQVKIDRTSFIDAMIPSTHVMIEQKSADRNLKAAIKQSDGSYLNPFQQAKKYSMELPYSKRPRWIVTCNFHTFHIYDMEKPGGDPEEVFIKNLEDEYYRLNFLVDKKEEHLQKELAVSFQAGEIVGKLYDALLKQYADKKSEESLRSLNMLCVRLVFCFYAEDAGIFGKRNMFHDYMKQFPAREWRTHLIELFQVLDTKETDRDKYLEDDLAEFPYVNGGLFKDEDVEIPKFTDEIVNLILCQASEEFDWSKISPTIFGAVFESTLNPETRKKGGMHYTSIDIIHKLIDPLFLDELRDEFDKIKEIKAPKIQKENLKTFQKKLASLKWMDPACGSGNFLTETYMSIRKLENEVISSLIGLEKGQIEGQMILGQVVNPVQVSISQFYGIEINDFAVKVAMTSLWIAESQMLKETENIIHNDLDFLPLKSYTNIHEGNALRVDWNDVVKKEELNYIIGNPPFVARAGRTSAKDNVNKASKAMLEEDQKVDRFNVFGEELGNVDYVACWFKKAAVYSKNTKIRTAFVATDSICQGQQVAPIWNNILKEGIFINFGYKFFAWKSEAKKQATVYIVIVGFSHIKDETNYIFDNGIVKRVKHISPYLIEADDILVETSKKSLCDMPEIGMGNQPIDDGNYLFSYDDMMDFIKKEPASEKWFKPWYGASEMINNKPRYCLWLGDCPPNELRKMPECLKRVEAVKQFRINSNRKSTKKLAEIPTHFQTENILQGEYLVIPEVSSGNRRYIPMAFMDGNVLCSNKVRLMPEANLYHFGILQSNVHMAWTRAVCGYYGPSYQYSIDIVYNNFPWPDVTEIQKKKIEETAQAILDARAKYPQASLADLYDELTMPAELLKAHQANNKAVMQAYGFWGKLNSEAECVQNLLKMYTELKR